MEVLQLNKEDSLSMATYEEFLRCSHSGYWQPKDELWRNWAYKTNRCNMLNVFNLMKNGEIASSVGLVKNDLIIGNDVLELYNLSAILASNRYSGAGVKLLKFINNSQNNISALGYLPKLGKFYESMGVVEVASEYSAALYIKPTFSGMKKALRRSKIFPFYPLLSVLIPVYSRFKQLKIKVSTQLGKNITFFNTFEELGFAFDKWDKPDDIAMLNLSPSFIKWRFLERPGIKYSVVGWKNNKELCWFIIRYFDKKGYYKTSTARVVDFGGNKEFVCGMLPELSMLLAKDKNINLIYFPIMTDYWIEVFKENSYVVRFLEKARLKLQKGASAYHITGAWSDLDYQVIQ